MLPTPPRVSTAGAAAKNPRPARLFPAIAQSSLTRYERIEQEAPKTRSFCWSDLAANARSEPQSRLGFVSGGVPVEVSRSLGAAEDRDDAEVVAGEGAVDGLVEDHAGFDGFAPVGLVAAADPDVVDAAVGFAEGRGEGVPARIGEAGRAVAGQCERVLVVRALALSQCRQSAQIADLVGVGLGIHVAHQHGRETVGRRERLDAADNLAHLSLADVALVELPVQVGDEEGNRTEGRSDLCEEQRAPLVGADSREFVDVRPADRPPREHGVAEPAFVARSPVGHVIAETVRDRRGLVEAVAVVRFETNDFLKTQDVRRERLDAGADRLKPVVPRTEPVPDVERRDADGLVALVALVSVHVFTIRTVPVRFASCSLRSASAGAARSIRGADPRSPAGPRRSLRAPGARAGSIRATAW